MAAPTLTARIDWEADGAFTSAIDSCVGRVLDCSWKRGRSADNSAEATGSASLTLDNFDDRYTPDRNWCDNPSFEAGTAGWSTAAIPGWTGPATSLTQVTDNAPVSTGTKAGEVVLGATAGNAVNYWLPYTFRAGVTYAVSVYLKSVSGGLDVGAILGVLADSDYAGNAESITTSWAAYMFAWTPSANRDGAWFLVYTRAAAAATARIDAVQVNPTTAYRDAVLATNPLSYWRLGESSGVTAVDEMGVNDGTYTNTPTLGVAGLLTGDSDTAVTLNGTTQYVNVPYAAALHPGDTFTLAALFKRTGAGHVDPIVSGGNSDFLLWYYSDDHLYLSKEAVSNVFVSTATYPDTDPHFIVATKAGANIHVYRDGVEIAGTVANATIVASGVDPVRVGGNSGADYAAGTPDEPAIWDRALSPAEIAGLYAAGTTAPTANTYIEAPTKGQLVPGRPVHIYATYDGTDYPQFAGYIERLTPRPADRTVEVTCYDPLAKMARRSMALPTRSRTHREIRIDVLNAWAAARRNYVPNPRFATDTAGWGGGGAGFTSLTRITTDGPNVEGIGLTCGEAVMSASSGEVHTGGWPNGLPPGPARVTFWARSVSGSTALTLTTYLPAFNSVEALTLTSSWQRFTIVVPMGAASSYGSNVRFSLGAAGTFRLTGASVTVGAEDWAFDAASIDYGAPDIMVLDDPSFEIEPPTNNWRGCRSLMVSNWDFETDLTGWSGAGDAFTTAQAIARTTADWYTGAASCSMTGTIATGQGFFYAITGTFHSGKPYTVYCAVKSPNSIGVTVGIGSQGTPADYASVTPSLTAGWVIATFTWTPSADRTDAHLFVRASAGATGTVWADTMWVWPGSVSPGAIVTTPVGFGLPADTWTRNATDGSSGSACMEVVGSGEANSGVQYITDAAVYVAAGQTVTFSCDVKSVSGSTALQIGIGNEYDSTDSSTAAFTATGAWTRRSVSWTPSAAAFGVPFIRCTAAAASAFRVDAVLLEVGAAASAFEPSFATLAVENGRAPDYSGGGTVAELLADVNRVTLTRHWVEATLAFPWFEYVTQPRAALLAASSAETYNDDVADVAGLEIDDTVVNVVRVTPGTKYIDANGATQTNSLVNQYAVGSDRDSVEKYSPHAGTDISSALLESPPGDRSVSQALADAIVAQGKDPRPRPRMTVGNRWPSQLQRQLGDVITLTFALQRIYSQRYSILTLDTKISEAGQQWDTTYVLEEMP